MGIVAIAAGKIGHTTAVPIPKEYSKV